MDVRLFAFLARQRSATLQPRERFCGLPKRGLAFVLANAMFWQPLWVQAADGIVVSAPGTSLGQAGNGVPIVNIAAPNGSGLSHNQFKDYNVGSNGVILNNATARTQGTQLGGIVLGNPNLNGKAARIILNEVNGANPSQLRGYTEVAGQSAAVIVANPHGISCNGCGFINTPQVTLTTGKPVLDAQGAVARYEVEGGSVSLDGAGLNADNVERFDIITRSARLNAQLHARELNIVTGRNDVDADTLAATVRAGSGQAAPALAIDSTALGGMYAGAIKLVGTEAGVGVRLAGDVAASAGDMQLDANGHLSVAQVSASGAVKVKAASVEVQGPVYGGTEVRVDSAGALVNQQGIAARERVTLQAEGTLSNRGVIEAGVNPDNSRNARGDVTLAAAQFDNAGKRVVASRNLAVDVRKGVDNRGGTLSAGQASDITAATLDNRTKGRVLSGTGQSVKVDQLLNAQGTVASATGALSVQASKVDNLGGELAGGKQLTLKAGQLHNEAGKLLSGGRLELVTSQLDNSAGARIIGDKGVTLDLQHGQWKNDGGLLHSAGPLVLRSLAEVSNRQGEISSLGAYVLAAGSLNNQGGKLLSEHDLTLSIARVLDNTRGLVSAGNVDARASGVLNQDGKVLARQQLTVQLQGALDNQRGELSASRTQLDAASLDNRKGHIQGDQRLRIDSQGALDNRNGSLVAGQYLMLATTTLDNRAGEIGSDGQAELKNTDLNNAGGHLYAAEKLTLEAAHVSNTDAGLIRAGQQLHADMQGLQQARGGRLYSAADLYLNLKGSVLDNQGGLIHAQGQLLLKGLTQVDNRQGEISSEKAFVVDAASMDNRAGVIASDRGLRLDINGALDNTEGEVSSGGLTWVQARSLVNREGAVLGDQSTELNITEALDNRKGVIGAGEGLRVQVGRLDNREGGSLVSDGSLRVHTDATLDNRTGEVRSSGLIELALGHLDNRDGVVSGGDLLTVRAASGDNQGGTLHADRYLQLFIDALDNRQGILRSKAALDYQGRHLDNSQGVITAAGRLQLDGDGVDNTKGRIASLANLDATIGVLRQSGGTLVAEGTLNLSGTEVDNRAGGLIASNGALLLKIDNLDNRAGELNSLLQVSIQGTRLDNSDGGRLLAGTRLALVLEQLINRNKGLVFGQALEVRGAQLDNQGGTLGAADALRITLANPDPAGSDGVLDNRQGRLDSAGSLTLDGVVLNNLGGTLSSAGDLGIHSAAALANGGGVIETDAELTLRSASLDNREGGRITAQGPARINTGVLDNSRGGLLGSAGHLHLLAGQVTNQAGGSIGGKTVDANVLGLAQQGGELFSQGSLVLDLNHGHLDNRDGLLHGAGPLTLLNLRDVANQRGEISSTQGFELRARNLDTRDGKVLSNQGLALRIVEQLDAARGLISARALNLQAGSLNNRDGVIGSRESADVQVTGTFDNQGGALVTDGALLLRAASVLNTRGQLAAKGNLQALVGELDNRSGELRSDADLEVMADGAVLNDGGLVASEANLQLSSASLSNDGGRLSSAGDLVVNSQGALHNQRGVLVADGQIRLASASLDNTQGGKVSAKGALLIDTGELDNHHDGRLASGDRLQLHSGLLDNSAGGRITSSKALFASVGGLRQQGGELYSADSLELDLRYGHLDNRGGLINTPGQLLLKRLADADNQGGEISSASGFDLAARNLNNDNGKVLSNQGLSLTLERALSNLKGQIAAASLQATAGNLDNAGGTLTSRGDLRLNISGLLNNTADGLINAGQALDASSTNLDNQGGLLLARTQLQVAAEHIDNSAQGLINSAGSLQLTARELLNDKGGEVSAKGAITLKADRLSQQGGRVLGSDAVKLVLLAGGGDLNNQNGVIHARGPLTLANLRDVNNRQGEISSDLQFNLIGGTLDNTGGKLISNRQLTLSAALLSNQGGLVSGWQGLSVTTDNLDNRNDGTLSSREGDLTVTVAGDLDNSDGGALASQGRLIVKATDLDNRAGILASAGDQQLDVRGGSLDNRQGGRIDSAGALHLQAASLDNRGGTLTGGPITLNVTGQLDNRQGKLVSAADLQVQGTAAVLNQAGQLLSQGRLDLAGTRLDNSDKGILAANGELIAHLERALLNDRDGLINSHDGAVLLNAGNLSNQNGAIQALTGLRIDSQGALDNQAGKLIAQTGEAQVHAESLDNRGGLLASVQGALHAEVGGLLRNDLSGVIQARQLRLIALGGLNNDGGRLAAHTGELNIDTANLANRGGGLFASGLLRVSAADLDNGAGGQIAGQDLDFSLRGALGNRNGVIESDTQLDVLAASLDNQGGQMRALGRAGRTQLHVAGLLDNQGGSLESANVGLVLQAGSLDNRGGKVLHGGTGELEIGMANLGEAGGDFVTLGGLTLNAASWNNSSAIQAGRLSVNVGELVQTGGGQLLAADSLTGRGGNWTNDGLIASNGALDIALTGRYAGSGQATSLGRLDLSAGSLQLLAPARIAGASATRVTSSGQFSNAGRITSANDLYLGADSLTNSGTVGSAGKLDIVSQVLLNQGQSAGDQSLISSGGDMRLLVGDFTNRFANVYSLGSLLVARDTALNRATRIENVSATLQSASAMGLYGQNVINRKDAFSVTEQVLSGTITYQCIDCKGRHYDFWYYVTEEIARTVQADSAAASINAGGSLAVRSDLFENKHSSVSAATSIDIATGDFLNEGASTESVLRTRKFRNPNDSERSSVWMGLVSDGGALAQYAKYNSKTQFKYFEEYYDDSGGYTSPIARGNQNTGKANPYYRPNSGVAVPQRILGYTLSETTETTINSGVAANAVVQAGGAVTISASRNLGNGVTRNNTGYATDALTGANIQTTRRVNPNVVSINAQLPPDLAQRHVNPLDLPGFVLPTGSNGLFRLSAEAGTGATGNSTSVVPGNWTLGGSSIDLAPREQAGPGRVPSLAELADASASSRQMADTPRQDLLPDTRASGVAVGDMGELPDTNGMPERTQAYSLQWQPAGGAGASLQARTDDAGVMLPGGIPASSSLFNIPRTFGVPDASPPSQAHKYLVETNPVLTDLKRFMSSDYLLGNLGYDPDQSWKRLGDGYFEQQLIQQAVTARTGQRFIGGQTSDEAVYRYLMDNALASKQQLDLSVGVTLTAQQVAALTHDIVWLEEQEVMGEKVLVPVLYLAHANARLAPNGALIQGQDVQLIAGQDLENSGVLRASNSLSAQAGNDLLNTGLIDAGNRLDLLAGNDLANKAGGIVSGRDVSLTAIAGDILNERTKTTVQHGGRHDHSQRDYLDAAARIEASNDLSLVAGRDLNNEGAVLQSGRDTELMAGRDVNIDAVSTLSRDKRGSSYLSQKVTQHAAQVDAGRDLTISAGRDISAVASHIDAKRDIALAAVEDITLASAANQSDYLSRSKKTTLQTGSVRQQATEMSAGGDISMAAGKDLGIVASRIKATGDIDLDAVQDVTITSALDESSYYYFKKKKGSFGRSSSKQSESYHSTNVASVLEAGHDLSINTSKAADGSLNLEGGRNVSIIGSELKAANDLLLGATEDIAVLSGVEAHGSFSKKTKSGFLGLSKSGASQLKTRATQVSSELEAGNDVVLAAGRDVRLRASDIAAGNDAELRSGLVDENGDINLVSANDSAYSLSNEYKKKTGLDVSGSWGNNISFNTAKKSGDEARSTTSVGSQVDATRDTLLDAARDINIVGSGVSAGRNLALDAGRDVNILAAGDSRSNSHWEQTKTNGLIIDADRNGFSAFFGKEVLDKRTSESHQTAAPSTVTADVNVVAGRDINQRGSDVQAGYDINYQAGRDIRIDAASERSEWVEFESRMRDGLTGTINHNLGSTLDTLQGTGKGEDGVSKGSSVLKSVDGVSQFLSGPTLDGHDGKATQSTTTTQVNEGTRGSELNAGNDINLSAGNAVVVRGSDVAAGRDINIEAKDVLLDVAKGRETSEVEQYHNKTGIKGGTTGGFKVGVGASNAQSDDSASSQYSTPTQLQAGRDVNIDASNNVAVIGSVVQAKHDIDIKAGNDLLIESTQNAYENENRRRSWGGEAGLIAGQDGLGVYGSINVGLGRQDREGVEQQQAYLYAGNQLGFESGRDTRIEGATLRGEDVVGKVGRDLTIASVADTGEVDGREFDANLTVAVSFGVTASGSVGYGETTGKTNWVREQTSISARDKVDIRTGEHTQIDGGLLVSDSGNLKLDTATLGFRDIAGKDEESGYYLNVGGSYGWVQEGGAQTDQAPKWAGDPDQKSWTVNGYQYTKDREQIVRATVGVGEIVVRNDAATGVDSTVGLNRDPGRAYEITRDEERRTDLYVSDTSVDAVRHPFKTLDTWQKQLETYKDVPNKLASGYVDFLIDIGREISAQRVSLEDVSPETRQVFGDERALLITKNLVRKGLDPALLNDPQSKFALTAQEMQGLNNFAEGLTAFNQQLQSSGMVSENGVLLLDTTQIEGQVKFTAQMLDALGDQMPMIQAMSPEKLQSAMLVVQAVMGPTKLVATLAAHTLARAAYGDEWDAKKEQAAILLVAKLSDLSYEEAERFHKEDKEAYANGNRPIGQVDGYARVVAAEFLIDSLLSTVGNVAGKVTGKVVNVVGNKTSGSDKGTPSNPNTPDNKFEPPKPPTKPGQPAVHDNGFRSEFYAADGTPVQWRNPLTGKVEAIPEGAKIHLDHIYPKKEIEALPGFSSLTPEQQRKLLNDPMNFQPLTASTNCSKGCRVNGTDNPWETYKGERLDPSYKQWLAREQAQMREYVISQISVMNQFGG